mgnify:CR=1 FL=1
MLLSNEMGTWSIGKLARAKTLSAAMGCDTFLVTLIVTPEHKYSFKVCRIEPENNIHVILEAFSCGVSVIATKVGGIQEFFPNEFGFLIDKKNEQQLLDKIISLYKEPKNQQPIMHQYAIDNFSSEKICDSFTKLYREALN